MTPPITFNALPVCVLLIPPCRHVSTTYVMTCIARFEANRGATRYALARTAVSVAQSDITAEYLVESLDLIR